MSEKTKEVKNFKIQCILKVCMVKLSINLVFMSTFDNQSMSIGCVGKLGHLFGFLQHYLLIALSAKLDTTIWIIVKKNLK